MKKANTKEKVTKRKLYSYPLSFKEVILNTDGMRANSLHKVMRIF
jgi:hypothetical protein